MHNDLCLAPYEVKMINYEEEIKRFKPSLDVEQIEDAIAKTDLTDMNDIMTKLIEDLVKKDDETR
jgi:hypothetical protein